MLVVSLAAAQASPPSQEMMIDIKSQPVIGALNDWAQQTSLQLVVPEEAADNDVLSQSIVGKYTAQQALDRLLIGTRLTYAFINARTVAIKAETKVAARPRVTMDTQEIPKPNAPVAGLEKVTVTGSRLPNDDIRFDGSVDTPAPVTVFDRERIDELGVSTVGELMKYVTQQPFRQFEGSTLSGAEHVNLRGLGFDTTLVLINGRRTSPSANSISSNAFDLNTIPLAAVDRLEFLSDSAAAVYGADAIGGVINVIFKKSIPGLVLDLHSGAADGGADERRAAVSTGYSNGRFRSLAVLDRYDREFLLGAARDRWRNQNYERFGGTDQRATTANPGNVAALAGNLPGLPSSVAAVPNGSSGVGLEPADFLATSGLLNKESVLRYRSIVPAADRWGLAGFADFEITPRLNLFGELLYTHRKGSYRYEPLALENVVVPASNPFNPFSTDVVVDYRFSGLGATEGSAVSELYRAVTGLRGAIDDWSWELLGLRTDEKTELVGRSMLDQAKVSAALAAEDPGAALNVFQDGPGGSPSLLASLLAPSRPTRSSSAGTQGATVLRGPLGRLPGGIAEMVVGAEWLDSHIFTDGSPYVDHGRTAISEFAELKVPLVGPAMKVSMVQGLSLTLAARHDRYSDFGESINPQYGLVWRLSSDVMLRASYGTSFRAPSLLDLHAPREEVFSLPIADRRRNNEVVSVRFLTGGNPQLKPTEADSFSTGFVFAPTSVEGLEVSGTYWRIRMDDRVTALPFDVILANEDRFADRVVRDLPTDANLPGVLRALDVTRVNFGSLETSGVDTTAGYSFDSKWGHFWQNLSATWVSTYKTMDVPDGPTVDRVGIANFDGSILKWRATATLGWSRSGIGLSATGRYSPAYDDANALSGPNGLRVDSQFLLDVQATLDVDKYFSDPSSRLPAFKLTVGISNLFDEEPGFSEITEGMGFDPSQGDLRQRFAYMRLSTKF